MASALQNDSGRGSALLAASRVWAQAASAILFLATSAMINPSQFGEFAIATSIFLCLAVIVGHGAYEYVMKARDSDTAAPTVFFINMATASVASITIFIIAAAIPHIVQGPNIPKTLMLLTPAFFLMGMNLLMESVVLKRGDITKVAVASVLSETVALGVAIGALFAGAGVLALVFHRVTREGVITLFYAASNRWAPQFLFDAVEAEMALAFTRNIVATRFVTMGSVAAVDVLIGAALSTADAGLFRLVSRLLTVGIDILFQPFRAAMWVSLPPLQNDSAAFGKTSINLLEVFGVGLFAVMTGVALIAAPAFNLTLGGEWQRAVPVIYAMTFARLLGTPLFICEIIFALKGKTVFMAVSSTVMTVLNLVAAFIAAPLGLYAVSASVVITMGINLLYVTPVLTKSAEMPVFALLNLMGRLSLNAIAMLAVAGPWIALGPRVGLVGWPLVGSTIILGAAVYIIAARKLTPVGYMPYEDAFLSVARRCQRLVTRKSNG